MKLKSIGFDNPAANRDDVEVKRVALLDNCLVFDTQTSDEPSGTRPRKYVTVFLSVEERARLRELLKPKSTEDPMPGFYDQRSSS